MKYIALRLHDGQLQNPPDFKVKVDLPEGCDGIMFVFRTKTAARNWWGKNIPLVKIQKVNKK